MRYIYAIIICLSLLLPSAVWADPTVAICFTPGRACDSELIEAINGAESSIRVAAYSFTSDDIADALIAARERGVKVWVVLDAGQWSATRAQGHRLREHGVGVRYDSKHAIQHNKYIIIDYNQTITGSYNFTASAQNRNAENMLIIDDKDIAKKYANNWGWHWWHSKREP